MKYAVHLLVVVGFVLSSCGKSGHQHDHNAMAGDSTNEALNTLIMSKHDEVMPKMEDLYNLKKKLQDTLARTPGLSAEKKKQFEAFILSLDSANASMMNWMHGYDPNKDSADQEKNRAYLENEIESINKISDQTLDVIDKVREAIEHKD